MSRRSSASQTAPPAGRVPRPARGRAARSRRRTPGRGARRDRRCRAAGWSPAPGRPRTRCGRPQGRRRAAAGARGGQQPLCPVGPHDQRRQVPRTGPAEPVDAGGAVGGGLLQPADEHRRQRTELQPGDRRVQAGEHLRRALPAVEGDAAQHAAQLGHAGGRLGVVPDDVADHQHRRAVRLREDVVPVAADLGLARRRARSGRRPAGAPAGRVGQQAALERLGRAHDAAGARVQGLEQVVAQLADLGQLPRQPGLRPAADDLLPPLEGFPRAEAHLVALAGGDAPCCAGRRPSRCAGRPRPGTRRCTGPPAAAGRGPRTRARPAHPAPGPSGGARRWRRRRPRGLPPRRRCGRPAPRAAPHRPPPGDPAGATATPSAGRRSSRLGEPSSVSARGRSSSRVAAVSHARVERTRSARWTSSSSARSTSRRDRVEPRNSAAARVA